MRTSVLLVEDNDDDAELIAHDIRRTAEALASGEDQSSGEPALHHRLPSRDGTPWRRRARARRETVQAPG